MSTQKLTQKQIGGWTLRQEAYKTRTRPIEVVEEVIELSDNDMIEGSYLDDSIVEFEDGDVISLEAKPKGISPKMTEEALEEAFFKQGEDIDTDNMLAYFTLESELEETNRELAQLTTDDLELTVEDLEEVKGGVPPAQPFGTRYSKIQKTGKAYDQADNIMDVHTMDNGVLLEEAISDFIDEYRFDLARTTNGLTDILKRRKLHSQLQSSIKSVAGFYHLDDSTTKTALSKSKAVLESLIPKKGTKMADAYLSIDGEEVREELATEVAKKYSNPIAREKPNSTESGSIQNNLSSAYGFNEEIPQDTVQYDMSGLIHKMAVVGAAYLTAASIALIPAGAAQTIADDVNEEMPNSSYSLVVVNHEPVEQQAETSTQRRSGRSGTPSKPRAGTPENPISVNGTTINADPIQYATPVFRTGLASCLALSAAHPDDVPEGSSCYDLQDAGLLSDAPEARLYLN